jgi:hypothetical protein
MSDLDLSRLVKPLEWTRFGSEWLCAESTLGRFEIMWGFHNGQVSLDVPKERRHHSWHPDIEAAQAAANADYAARVLAPIDTALIEELVEALKFYADPEGYETTYTPLPCGCCTDISGGQCEMDAGDRARAALAKLKEGAR